MTELQGQQTAAGERSAAAERNRKESFISLTSLTQLNGGADGKAQVAVDLEPTSSLEEQDGGSGKHHAHPRWIYVTSLAWVGSVSKLAALFVGGLAVVAFLFSRLPDLETLSAAAALGGGAGGAVLPVEGDLALRLSLPRSFEELRAVRHTLELYRANYGGRVAALLIAAYLFLQTFMLPGSMLINLLAGSLYPFWHAMAFTAAVSTVGACSNFWVGRWLLRDLVVNLFPARVAAFSMQVRRHQGELLYYMLFAHVVLQQSWFINLASPIVGVPFPVFLLGTALGHQPSNLITVQAGEQLGAMESLHDLYSPRNILFLLGVGLLALLPVALRRWRRPPQLLPTSAVGRTE